VVIFEEPNNKLTFLKPTHKDIKHQTNQNKQGLPGAPSGREVSGGDLNLLQLLQIVKEEEEEEQLIFPI